MFGNSLVEKDLIHPFAINAYTSIFLRCHRSDAFWKRLTGLKRRNIFILNPGQWEAAVKEYNILTGKESRNYRFGRNRFVMQLFC